jgi:hypothetical protein
VTKLKRSRRREDFSVEGRVQWGQTFDEENFCRVERVERPHHVIYIENVNLKFVTL